MNGKCTYFFSVVQMHYFSHAECYVSYTKNNNVQTPMLDVKFSCTDASHIITYQCCRCKDNCYQVSHFTEMLHFIHGIHNYLSFHVTSITYHSHFSGIPKLGQHLFYLIKWNNSCTLTLVFWHQS